MGPLATAKYYLELVCVSLSVACLLLTFLTYCLFSSLRTLPGLNNMSLCLSLAVAHTCLLVTARHGAKGQLPPAYCTVHAVVLHYSWLAACQWMGVACVHMFRVFTCHGTKFTHSKSDTKRYLHYCAYAYGMPILVIVLTVAINCGLTSNAAIGYDSHTCFLDVSRSILNVVLPLFLPICLMLAVNTVLFVLTVREIVHVSSLQEHSRTRERHGVITYVKLSSLTGVFFIVTVVAVQLNSPALELVTSPLVALQGVFIFLSFTVTRRVGQLFAELLACPSLTSTGDQGTDTRSRDNCPDTRSTTDGTRI